MHDIFQTRFCSNAILVMRRKQEKYNPSTMFVHSKQTLKYVSLKLAKKSKITKKLISSVEINIIAETCLKICHIAPAQPIITLLVHEVMLTAGP